MRCALLARLARLAAVLLAVGCSSKVMAPPTDPPTVPIALAPASPSPTASASAPASAPAPTYLAIVRLLDLPYDPLVPPSREIDWAVGQLPGPAFPAGTVYIAAHDYKTDDPVSVTEWDLSRAAVVHTVVLPISPEQWQPWILRVGEHLRVLASGENGTAYVQLSLDLRVEHVEEWNGYVRRGIQSFRSDEQLMAVTYEGTASGGSEGNSGRVLAVFDASGRRRALRVVQQPEPEQSAVAPSAENTAVLGGKIFVVRTRLWCRHQAREVQSRARPRKARSGQQGVRPYGPPRDARRAPRAGVSTRFSRHRRVLEEP